MSPSAPPPSDLPSSNPMGVYIYFSDAFKKFTRGKIARDIYFSARGINVFLLWLSKLFFLSLAIIQILSTFEFNQPSSKGTPYFLGAIIFAGIWGFSFNRTRNSYFSNNPQIANSTQTEFNENYQYIRYNLFKERIRRDGMENATNTALEFISSLSETEHKKTIYTHPAVALPIGLILAIVGAKASGWDLYIVATIVASAIVCIYFASMILYTTTTKEEEKLEMKRFLLWISKGI